MTVIYLILIFFGFIPFLVVLYKIRKVKLMKKSGVKTVGIVREISGTPSRGLNSIAIEYFLEGSNNYIRKELTVAGMPYHIGQVLPLYYDKENPHNMLFDSGKGFIVMIIFTLLIAAFFIAACFMINNSILKGEL